MPPAPSPSPRDAAALAAEAHLLLGEDPRRARELAAAALDAARARADDVTTAVALRALGLVALELEGAPEALVHLRAAVAAARRAGSDARLAEARMSLAHALMLNGESTAALRQAGLAMKQQAARGDGRLAQQHALILMRLGRYDEALEGYRRALALVRRAANVRDEVIVLLNRGIVQTYRGALRAAAADLAECETLARDIGQPLFAAFALGNRGFVAARSGDLPGALECYDAAEPVLADASQTRRAILELDRCHALLAAGLHHEAVSCAGRVVELFERCAMATELTEARLVFAEAALAGGDAATARRAAEQAASEFTAQQRPGWAAQAENVGVRAAFAAGVRDATLLARARHGADALVAAGWPTAALDARVLAGRIALALGRPDEAALDLEPAARARDRGPVVQRLGAWHAEALQRLAGGRRAGALRALRAGLAVLDAHRVSLGATELRTGAAVHGNALTALGLSLALASGRAEAVLEWAERGRAGALWQRPARPPDDAELAAELGELRALLAAVDEAGKENGDTRRLLRRQAELEASIRRRARHASGSDDAEQGAPPPPRELRAALGARVLVQYVPAGGDLSAVVASGSRPPRLVRLGSIAAIAARELGSLRFGLRKLGRGSGSAASRRVARANVEHAAQQLDALLLAPLADLVGETCELVLIPTGDLHAVPWAVLPSCADRPVSVAPSAALWLRAARRRGARAPREGESLLLAAGPGLPGAAAEVRALARGHAGARALLGEDAAVDAVATALETATRAHIASHGTFRADNPLFSSLQLADGPLTVYDLERLRATPRDMILSACDGGVTAVRPGDELMGFSGALLALGTSALVASVVPVPDEPTHRLMLALHERLDAGDEPAAALARARDTALDAAGDADVVTAAGFVCFGAGSPAAGVAATPPTQR